MEVLTDNHALAAALQRLMSLVNGEAILVDVNFGGLKNGLQKTLDLIDSQQDVPVIVFGVEDPNSVYMAEDPHFNRLMELGITYLYMPLNLEDVQRVIDQHQS